MNHIARLLHLLSRLIVSVVKEIGGVAVEIHRIAFGEQLILYFEDTKKRIAAPCLIHEALVDELIELCGADNVVVKS